MFSLNASRGNGGVHGRLVIVTLQLDISRVDRPVLHARTMNDAVFSMIADGRVRARARVVRVC